MTGARGTLTGDRTEGNPRAVDRGEREGGTAESTTPGARTASPWGFGWSWGVTLAAGGI